MIENRRESIDIWKKLLSGGVRNTDATPYSIGSKHRVCARNNSHIETGTIPQKHFQIYNGNTRVNKIYLGNALIMDANAGTEALVK